MVDILTKITALVSPTAEERQYITGLPNLVSMEVATLMIPTTAQDWLNVASERAADADAIQKTRCVSVGCIYMALA